MPSEKANQNQPEVEDWRAAGGDHHDPGEEAVGKHGVAEATQAVDDHEQGQAVGGDGHGDEQGIEDEEGDQADCHDLAAAQGVAQRAGQERGDRDDEDDDGEVGGESAALDRGGDLVRAGHRGTFRDDVVCGRERGRGARFRLRKNPDAWLCPRGDRCAWSG
ncbi:hypothetical protein [uncultured Actinomyces sp.]|uniref:hypothetical protein n=1 Tax=uncultured Actinomyces sp. TaxID=249061 RepID=UPI002805413B|nr:hypothetical protein [uncultured Actinomyces sp.]